MVYCITFHINKKLIHRYTLSQVPDIADIILEYPPYTKYEIIEVEWSNYVIQKIQEEQINKLNILLQKLEKMIK